MSLIKHCYALLQLGVSWDYFVKTWCQVFAFHWNKCATDEPIVEVEPMS